MRISTNPSQPHGSLLSLNLLQNFQETLRGLKSLVFSKNQVLISTKAIHSHDRLPLSTSPCGQFAMSYGL